MEQFYRSLLQQEGYEHIGIIDAVRKIYGFAKDGVYHFCREDLTEIDRKEIGIFDEVVVLSIKDGNIARTGEQEFFSSCLILDKSNIILRELHPSTPPYIFRRLNTNSIVITKPVRLRPYTIRKNVVGWDAFLLAQHDNSQILVFDYYITESLRNASEFICLDGVDNSNLFLYMYHEDCYFFLSEEGMKVYHPKKGTIYQIHTDKKRDSELFDSTICFPDVLMWEVKNHGVFFVESYSESKESANIVKIIPMNGSPTIEFNMDDISKSNREKMHNLSHKLRVYTHDAMCSEEYLILYLSGDEGLFVIHTCSEDITAKCLFNYSRKTNYSFKNGIIESVYSYEDGYYSNGEFDTFTRYEHRYYDAECHPLNVAAENNRYLIYWKYVSINNRLEKRYGVFKKDDCQTILPPIYNAISFNDDDTFDVELKNIVNEKEQLLNGLFSAEKGFILPIGMEYHHPEYWNNITGISINTAEANYFNIFSFGEHEGLMFGSEKVLEPIYDSIEGFPFWEKFNEDEDSWYFDKKEAEKRTKEYQPLSVILYKDGKRGLFIDKEHIIEPIFDCVECCKVLKGHAYFEVQQGGEKGIISDDIEFNEICQDLYDNLIIEDHGKIVYFYIYKEGKVGMISTNKKYSIPVKFEELQAYSNCYIGDGKIYCWNGEELYNADDYEIEYAEGLLVLKNIHSKEYVVLSYTGRVMKSKMKADDDNVIEITGDYNNYYYYIRSKEIEKEERDVAYYGPDYPTDDDIKMGMMEAYNGDPELQLNTD